MIHLDEKPEGRPMDDIAATYDPNISEPAAEEPLQEAGEKELKAESRADRDDHNTTTYEPVKDHSSKPAHTETRPEFSRTATNATTATSASGYSVASREAQKEADAIAPERKWYSRLAFKSRHVPPIPKERTACPEYTAGFFSLYTFNWMQPIMSTGYQRPLELNDIWLVNPDRSAEVMSRKMLASFSKRVERKDKRPLLGAMYETFKFEFILAGVCQLISSVVSVITPFVLRYLISFSQEAYYARFNGAPAPHVGKGIGLVIAITLLQTIQSGAQNHSLYRGMMNGGQARATLISLIFDKAMKLSGRARAGGNISDSNKEKPSNLKPGSEEEKNWFMKKLKRDKKSSKKGKKGAEEEHGWGNGRIINLMSVDTYRIDQASWGFHQMWTSPLAILITLALLLVNITYSALAGFGLIIIAMPVLGKTIKTLFIRRKAINKITDQRVSLTQEILQAVRFVKYFGWETSFLERLGGIRKREISAIQVLLTIRNAINAISMSIPVFASMLAFITFSLTNHRLNPAYIFSSLALFNSLRLPLNLLPLVIGQNVDALASVTRIQDFLLAEEAKDEADVDLSAKNAVEVRNASFTWERSPVKESEKSAAELKKDLKQEKVDIKAAKKAEKLLKAERKNNEKAGLPPSSGSDSSSTLAETAEEKPFTINNLNFSIGRNELVAVIGGVGSGKSSLLAALAGDMRRTAGDVTLGASRAFCPQYAWIQNATVKENVMFGKDYNSRWYNEVIDACALRADLEMLPNGDRTEIGERGITVSGGQKQRLNIARAIYFDSDLVIMDDPLSAVDAHVGRHIMDQAICGLLSDKCRILATHQLWVLDRCDRIIWMENGEIQAIDTFNNLMSNSPEFVKLMAKNDQEEKKEEEIIDEDEVADEKKEAAKKKKGKRPTAALMQVEERAVSNVSWDVYKAYLKASGSMLNLPLCLILLILSQGANIATSLWLSWWTSNKFGFTEGTYIGTYAALGVSQAICMFLFSITLSILGTNASKKMLQDAVYHVLRAPMSFFDTTPLGRITNRFSKDIDTMDNMLTDSIRFFLMTMAQIVSVFILIIAYFYYFAVALAPLLLLFLFSAGYYRASAREVKRHESVLRSTVFARFSEAVSGISTIRAYGLEERFSQSIREAVDEMDSAYYLTFSNQRWLSTRLDIIGNLLVFVLGILIVTSRFSVSPSTGGLVLSYILSVVQMIQFTVRQLAEVENHMNATERVHYYGTQLDQEPPQHIGDVPESWPAKGEIVFNQVEMRYRDGLPLVLRGLDLHVRGGERIGVVGRTGAGKSSIMSTLFRLVEISGGSITIDGININQVGLYDLRQRMSIIPQDPTLFKGTVRSNLDPFNKYNDLELWSALRQADLVGEDQQVADKTGRIHLDSPVDEEGLNFSLGQRQLMALARALVRGSRIIVCDEATSSVDLVTDNKIQKTISEGFKGKTLLTIAHRLSTILNYDRILVLDAGTVAELDTPINLFDQGGIFYSMCMKSSIRREDIAAS